MTPDHSLLRLILHRATRGPVDLPEFAPFERVAGELDAALKWLLHHGYVEAGAPPVRPPLPPAPQLPPEVIRRVTPAGRELLASLVRDGTEMRVLLRAPRSLAPIVPLGVSMAIAALAAGAFAWLVRGPASREPEPPAAVAADSTGTPGTAPESEGVERAADLALLRRLAAGRRAFALAAGGDTLRARTARERLEARTLHLVEQRLARPLPRSRGAGAISTRRPARPRHARRAPARAGPRGREWRGAG